MYGFDNRNLFSHSSGGWEVQDQDAGWFSSWWALPSWLVERHLLTVSSHGRLREQALWCVFFSSVQFSRSVVSDSLAIPWIAARQASLSITNSRSSPKLTSIESVMPSSHLILCHPLLLLPPIPPSIRVISNESTLRMRWPKYWSFSFSISPSNEHPGLISLRIAWFDLLVIQETLESLLQYNSLKA